MKNAELTKKEIELICDYMGYEKQNDGYTLPDNFDKAGSERNRMWYFIEEIPYMEWNFIIPVVQKIVKDYYFGDDNYETWYRAIQNKVADSLFSMDEQIILRNILTYLKIKAVL